MGLFRRKKRYDYDPYEDYNTDEYYDEYYDDDYDEEYYGEYYDDEYYDDYDPYDFDDVDYERERGARSSGRKKSRKSRRKDRKAALSADDYELWNQYQRRDYDEDFYSDSYASGKERRGFGSWLKRFFTRLFIIALLLGGLFIAYKVYVKAPNAQVLGGILNFAEKKNAEDGSETEKIPDSEAPNGEIANVRKGVYTFLIVGKDVEGAHTDTVIVGMFDTAVRKLNFVSIPRDMLINSEWNVKKINYVYPASVNQGKDGTANLLEAISQLLGYPVGSYAILDITAAQKLVDAIGGVYFDVPCDMDWDAPDQTIPLHIHIKKGYQRLDGEQAVNVLRFRYSNDGSNSYPRGDLDRIDVQQDLMKAILGQTLSVKNIPNLSKLLKIFEENVETNLKASNLAFFAQEFLKLKPDDINFMVMPGEPDGVIYGMNYVIPDIDGWLQMVNEYLNPFDRPILKENVDMLSYDGVDFITTQGKIRGGRDSFMGSWRG